MKQRMLLKRIVALQPNALVAMLVILGLVFSTFALAQDDLAGAADTSYRLGAGDKLQIDVFNQQDLTGEYTLMAMVALPCI